MKKSATRTLCLAQDPRLIAANVGAAESVIYDPADTGQFAHDRVVAFNSSRFSESFFSEPLTNYAVGFRDNNDIEATLEFFAPKVMVPRKFEYASFTNIEEFYSEATDDLRALGSSFKQVEYTQTKVQAKTENRGLQICVDLDEVGDMATWKRDKVAKLIRRLRRNSLRRAVALLSAAATNTAKTWDTTAGKDPDQDVLSDLVTAATAAGVRPTRVGYGDTAWTKRVLAHRAQTTAGGFGSAAMTPEQVAMFLAIEKAMISRERYASGTAAKAEIANNLVLMFNAESGADTEDASNIKRFVSNTDSGGEIRVYEQQLSAKQYVIAVELYELTKITSTLGIRKFTVS